VKRSSDLRLGALVAFLLVALNALSVSSELGFLHKAKQVKESDHWRYIHMSRGEHGQKDLQQQPPYCYRVAVPAAARLLVRAGLGENTAFYALTSASVFGFLFLLWAHLGDLGFSLPLRVTGVVLAGLTQGAVRWPLYQYWMTDPAGLFLVMLAFHLVERGRRAGLLATSVVAAFVRESYVLVYPYVLLRELRDGRRLLPAALRIGSLAVVPLAILVTLRVTIPATGPNSFTQDVVENVGFRWRLLLDNQLYLLTIGSFGVLFVLPLLVPDRIPRLVRRHFDRAFFVASVYLSLVVTNNTERPLAYALPALVPAALAGLRAFLEQTRLPPWPVLSTAVALQALFLRNQRFAESGMSIYQPVSWTTTVALLVACALAWLVLRRRRGRPAAGPVAA
jgi:uncharacterized protein (TIGR03382 family)